MMTTNTKTTLTDLRIKTYGGEAEKIIHSIEQKLKEKSWENPSEAYDFVRAALVLKLFKNLPDAFQRNLVKRLVINLTSKKNKLSKKPSRKKPKYTKIQLWEIAFDRAYAEYFQVVDDDGKPVKERFKDFDYFSLLKKEKELYDDFYDINAEFCKELYEKETGG